MISQMAEYQGVAPGVFFKESEEQGYREGDVSNAVAIVGPAPTGPTGPQLITQATDIEKLYGKPIGVNTALRGLYVVSQFNNEVYFNRVVSKNALVGTADIAENLVMVTKYPTDVYNGYRVSIKTSPVNPNVVEYKLTSTTGQVLENYKGSKRLEDKNYIIRVLNMYSNYLDVTTQPTGTFDVADTEVEIRNGNSGMDVTEDDIVEGMEAFKDPEVIDFATLIVPNFPCAKVYAKAKEIKEYRKDIVYIPSLPFGLRPDDVAMYVNGSYVSEDDSKSNSFRLKDDFMQLYYPNGYVYDEVSGTDQLVDITPYIAATWGRSDGMSALWYAPAGEIRGRVPFLTGLEQIDGRPFNKEERDMLYSSDVNVNSVVNVRGVGICIWGVHTAREFDMTATNTALKYISVRRTCNYIRKMAIMKSRKVLFDQNDEYAWNSWKLAIEPIMRNLKNSRALIDFRVEMGNGTMSHEDIDHGIARGIITAAFIRPLEYIYIDFVCAKDGTISLQEREEA